MLLIGIIILYLIWFPAHYNQTLIISVTTVVSRLNTPEFRIGLNSLLNQTSIPFKIHVYYSNDDIEKFNLEIQSAKEFQDDRVIWIPTLDVGPATKYLPVIKNFKHLHQFIMVCDDDHYYHTSLAFQLNSALIQNLGIVGARGWRLTKNITWGKL